MSSGYIDLPVPDGGAPGSVDSINGITGVVTIAAGSGISVNNSGQTITIANTTGGTVTSVAMTAPTALFTSPVSGSPITTSGTLALALSTQTANIVFAGPSSGGAATPTFRALVSADIPSLGYITALSGDVTTPGGGSGVSTIAVGAVTDTKGSLANKPALTVVATSNQTLSGIPTIDGVSTLIDGSTILLTAQSTGSENGPWVIHSGAWTRPTWFPSGGTTQAVQFSTTLIRLGTTYQGSTWRLTTAGVTIDTTSQTWSVTPLSINSNTTTGLFGTTTKTANYTIAATDSTIFVDTSGGAFNLTLPSPSTVTGKPFRIVGTSGTMNTNPITLVRFGSEQIEGLAASKLLQTNWGFFTLISDGTNWFVG